MGTRSITTFIQTGTNFQTKRKRTQKIVTMYRQYDGYPSGHGLELALFLADGELVNGYGSRDVKQFNGMGCMAAQVVAHLKEGVGNIYLEPVRTKADWEDYTYEVIGDMDKFTVTLIAKSSDGTVIFKGTPQEFLNSSLVER
jgi:hypothetical protein